MESTLFCTQCGRELQPMAKFCQGCGSQIAEARVSGDGLAFDASSSTPVPPEPFSEQSRKTEPIFVQSLPFESSNRSDDTGPSRLLMNRIFFVLSYLVFAAPTYVLPYFGSNSSLFNVTGAALGLGALPQFWYHLVALYLLVVIAWLRGAHTGRPWIAIFPFLAGIFDMVPGLNWFLLIPTGFHVVTLVMGVKGEVVSETNAGAPKQRFAISSAGLIILVILSAIKTQSFLDTAEKGPSLEMAPEQPKSKASMVSVPPLEARVMDLTDTLSSLQLATLKQTLYAFERSNGSNGRQIAVLLVPTTQSETIEQYTARVSNTWRLGGDSALLLIAKKDRKVRIATGDGLSGVFSDATFRNIIEEEITPRFKQGDYYGGITAGVDKLIKTLDSNLPGPL